MPAFVFVITPFFFSSRLIRPHLTHCSVIAPYLGFEICYRCPRCGNKIPSHHPLAAVLWAVGMRERIEENVTHTQTTIWPLCFLQCWDLCPVTTVGVGFLTWTTITLRDATFSSVIPNKGGVSDWGLGKLYTIRFPAIARAPAYLSVWRGRYLSSKKQDNTSKNENQFDCGDLIMIQTNVLESKIETE